MAKIERVLHNHCNAHCTLEQTSPQRFDALSDLRVENDTAHSSGTWSWRNPGAGRSRSGRGRGPGAAAGGWAGGAGWGRVGPGGAGGDVVCSGSKPNGLCPFGVKCHLVAKIEGGVAKI